MDIFKTATKEKYRFPYKGMISVEDLWDLNLAQLDGIYKSLNAQKKTAEEDSLLGQHTKEDQTLQNKIEIVKDIFAEKQAEKEAVKRRIENAEEKRRIMEIIASKEDAALKEKSIDDLKKMLSELE